MRRFPIWPIIIVIGFVLAFMVGRAMSQNYVQPAEEPQTIQVTDNLHTLQGSSPVLQNSNVTVQGGRVKQ